MDDAYLVYLDGLADHLDDATDDDVLTLIGAVRELRAQAQGGGHCFAHGQYDGLHCVACHGGATLNKAERLLAEIREVWADLKDLGAINYRPDEHWQTYNAMEALLIGVPYEDVPCEPKCVCGRFKDAWLPVCRRCAVVTSLGIPVVVATTSPTEGCERWNRRECDCIHYPMECEERRIAKLQEEATARFYQERKGRDPNAPF